MIWQMTYTHKLPKLCSATLTKKRFIDSISVKTKMKKKLQNIVLKYYTTLFIALFCIKTKDGKSLNFLTKTIV